jgi:hypothetical protein
MSFDQKPFVRPAFGQCSMKRDLSTRQLLCLHSHKIINEKLRRENVFRPTDTVHSHLCHFNILSSKISVGRMVFGQMTWRHLCLNIGLQTLLLMLYCQNYRPVVSSMYLNFSCRRKVLAYSGAVSDIGNCNAVLTDP